MCSSDLDYIIPFDDIDVSLEDENYIFNLLKSHDQTKVLDYHGYLSPRLTFKTKLAKDLKNFGEKLNLRLAGIYAFTANANTHTSIHVDGDEATGPLPWRLCWYCRGDAAVLNWYDASTNTKFNDHDYAFIYPDSLKPIMSIKLDMKSAFVRTEVPHNLDLSGTKENRLTITATFKPYISWKELQGRLAHVKDC